VTDVVAAAVAETARIRNAEAVAPEDELMLPTLQSIADWTLRVKAAVSPWRTAAEPETADVAATAASASRRTTALAVTPVVASAVPTTLWSAILPCPPVGVAASLGPCGK
jgi:hypothetical protein